MTWLQRLWFWLRTGVSQPEKIEALPSIPMAGPSSPTAPVNRRLNPMDAESVPQIVAVLEEHPQLSGSAVVLLLWDMATGQQSRALGECNQSEEYLEKFYRRFPSLREMRPLLACPVCEWPPINLVGLIRHLSESHFKTALETANIIRSIWIEYFHGKYTPDWRFWKDENGAEHKYCACPACVALYNLENPQRAATPVPHETKGRADN